MVTTTYLEVAALNVVASPHPPGIYVALLREVAGVEIPLWGSDWAKITAPSAFEDRKGFHHGQVLIWTPIDTDQKWLNKDKDTEATVEEMRKVNAALPGNLEPNFRLFTYILDEAEHTLLIEIKNEFGARFSPTRAERVFNRLFEGLSSEWPDVSITVIPEDETLAKIFAIPRLRKLEILISRPNADDVGDDFNRIMSSMQEEGAKDWRIEKTRAPKQKTLKPNDETKRMAAVGAINGHVSGEGTDDSGNPVFESTKEHPKIKRVELVASAFGAILSAHSFFRRSVGKSGVRD